jgi:malonate-semialdehyde dehydrogenase (acetylating)/methylmalonate-semialdehyde dehydrogenase
MTPTAVPASIDGDLHANGRDAAEFYTRKKVVTSRWAA